MSKPANSLIGLLNYNPEAQLLSEAKALRQRMSETVGEVKARVLWSEAGTVRRGRIKGHKRFDVGILLKIFDACTASPIGKSMSREELAREIAGMVHEKARNKFGATPAGIAASVKRALKERDRREAEWQALLAKGNPFDRSGGLGGLGGFGSHSMNPDRRNALVAALMAPDTKSGDLLSGGHEIGTK